MSLHDQYKGVTPDFWRKFGDGLLAAGSFVTAYAISDDIHWLGYTALGMSVIGKFLTNLFKKD
jgi:hypothetical protein